MAWKLAVVLSLALSGSAGCNFGTKEFTCSLDTECPASGGEYGRCVNRHCAFRDNGCASGYVYDESAGDDANKCVPEADFVTDAAPPPIDAGPTPDAPPLSADGGATGPDSAPLDAAAPDA